MNQHTSPPDSDDAIDLALQLERPRSRRRWLKWLLLLLLVGGALFLFLPRGGNDHPDSVRYQTAEADRGPITVLVTATGTLEPVNQVEVGSEISGTIRRVPVDFNDRVKAGDVLAELDTDQLQAKVKQAEASLALARAGVNLAEATVVESRNKLRRGEELKKKHLCSDEECDALRAAYDRALAELARARAQVLQAEASLSAEHTTLAKATIHAPIDGIVLNRDVDPGQTVAASFQTPVLFTLAENLTQMELHVDVDEADVGQVRVGQSATFTVDAYPDRRFPATITEVRFASQTVEGVVTYRAVLGVDNAELLLRPGMTATADIRVEHVEDALRVPNAALRFTPPKPENGAQQQKRGLLFQLFPRPRHTEKKREASANDGGPRQVWVLQDGAPKAIPVTTGITDGVLTQVVDGKLKPGVALITGVLTTPSR
ncbi:efflux RND transporter periplasmic adaptor subunit [Endothiovibrio diazotrophicus]